MGLIWVVGKVCSMVPGEKKSFLLAKTLPHQSVALLITSMSKNDPTRYWQWVRRAQNYTITCFAKPQT
ncbi:hypothetical protein COY32_06640 [candidate division WWE3 bacterium CG_4_10_14_0_2_um_filter_41_14]|uniref:Uncharacterized protein n=1 Tax=candidate division WWE3 bacterium CG_4_10_14_0_2_um_filter_41_14 TaxID=1975072 RepID=A0A2M7TEY8_UNCKA|nr:MAG: hypothetical protein COY32_06640 [candidate division WWE3 bacterium CG_4_10_14_0_2_um_filter_41_14]